MRAVRILPGCQVAEACTAADAARTRAPKPVVAAPPVVAALTATGRGAAAPTVRVAAAERRVAGAGVTADALRPA